MRWLVLLVLLPGVLFAQGYRPPTPAPRSSRADVAASYTATPVAIGELGTCSGLAGTYASVTGADPYFCTGVDWNRVLTEADLNADVDILPRGVIAQAASGEYAFRALHGGAKFDFGPSTGDDECAYGNTTSSGSPTVECGIFTFSQANVGQISPRGTTQYVYVVAGMGLKLFGFNLGTCNAGSERSIVVPGDAGGTTGHRTRICICASDGAATPAYYWVNTAGTVGTTTTCPYLEP